MTWLLTLLVRVYQWTLSPLLHALNGGAGGCRYLPTCSEYAIEALRLHGAWRGSWLTVRRLLRCHPWGGHGFDPVPGSTGAAAQGEKNICAEGQQPPSVTKT